MDRVSGIVGNARWSVERWPRYTLAGSQVNATLLLRVHFGGPARPAEVSGGSTCVLCCMAGQDFVVVVVVVSAGWLLMARGPVCGGVGSQLKHSHVPARQRTSSKRVCECLCVSSSSRLS